MGGNGGLEHRQRDGGGWAEFRRFAAGDDANLNTEGLQAWRASWVFGGPKVARYLTDRLARRSAIARRLPAIRRLFG